MSDIRLPEPLHSLVMELEPKTITNFYGAPGTGKTCASILAMIACAKSGGRVIYIDTENGLSYKRVQQIHPPGVPDNVEILEPSTFQEQGQMIRGLVDKAADLIVVDSMVSLYRLEYTDPKVEAIEANRELSKQLSVLSKIAKDRNIPVIITAHTFENWDTGENEVVGGNVIKYWSKSIIYIERTGKTSERKAIITKHRHMPEGKSVKFDLVEEGIRPAGFKLF
ncbi:MAG: DNA repair and recombination protein RadB [Candidatus Aenigmatarchaeota archaeon]